MSSFEKGNLSETPASHSVQHLPCVLLVSSSGCTLGEPQPWQHFRLVPCNARKKPFSFPWVDPRALLNIATCAMPEQAGTFLSWVWFQKNFLSCCTSFLCHHFVCLLCWCPPPPAGGAGKDMHGHGKQVRSGAVHCGLWLFDWESICIQGCCQDH